MIRKVIGIYFSPVGGTAMMTESLAREVAGKLNECSPEDITVECHDLLRESGAGIQLNEDTIAVIGMPVCMGKIPLPGARALEMISGTGALTLAAVSYGGRSYGNALYELQHCAEDLGLSVIGAGAFLVRYQAVVGSQKRSVAMIDMATLDDFCKAASDKIKRLSGCEVEGLKIRPMPVELNGRMPVHKISRISPKAAAFAQEVCERLSLTRRHSEWFL